MFSGGSLTKRFFFCERYPGYNDPLSDAQTVVLRHYATIFFHALLVKRKPIFFGHSSLSVGYIAICEYSLDNLGYSHVGAKCRTAVRCATFPSEQSESPLFFFPSYKGLSS